MTTVNVIRFVTFFFFCSKDIMVIQAEIYKYLLRMANMEEDPYQAVSSEIVGFTCSISFILVFSFVYC